MVCRSLGKFVESYAQIVGFNDVEVAAEREEPGEIPVPFAAFDHKRNALFVALFVENLEWGFFSDPLGSDRIYPDRSFHPLFCIFPSAEKLG